MWRLIATKRWLGYLALTVVFAIVASFFGVWQWDRRTQAVEAIEVLERNWSSPPIPLEEWSGARSVFPVAEEWRQVMTEGEYISEDQLLVRTRPRSGQVGFEILVPFRTTTGDIVLVNRGWVPTGQAQDFPDLVPLAPTGLVSLVGRVKPSEPLLAGRGAPEGQVPSVYLSGIASNLDYPMATEFYLLLHTENPSPGVAPLPAVKPMLDEGPHLSYTFQWYIFGLLAFIGFFWMLRQEYRLSQGIEPVKKRGTSDAEEEDSLLESAKP
jgi:cytochrome oxidase assembly protein ShyY1